MAVQAERWTAINTHAFKTPVFELWGVFELWEGLIRVRPFSGLGGHVWRLSTVNRNEMELASEAQRNRSTECSENLRSQQTRYTQTLLALSKPLFGPAYRRGSPSRIEGLGSSMDGVKGESPPCGFGQRPRSFFCHAERGGGGSHNSVADHVPNVIWYSVLHLFCV